MKSIFSLFILLLLAGGRLSAQDAVLASGNFYLLKVHEDGIYKLDFSFFQQAGLNPAQIDPDQIRLFSGMAGMLPLRNSSPRPEDLQELAIAFVGGEDGRFDPQDYLLFYGQSPHTVQLDSATGLFYRQTHLYAEENYYFLNIAQQPTIARIQEKAALPGQGVSVSSFQDFVFLEEELNQIMPSPTGQKWLGELFTGLGNQASYKFPVNNLMPGTMVKIWAQVAAQSPEESSFSFGLNGQNLGEIAIPASSTATYGIKGVLRSNIFSKELPESTNEFELSLAYSRPANSSQGYLDFVAINFQRRLNYSGQPMAIRGLANASDQIVTYQIAQAVPDLWVWELTDPMQPVSIPTTVSGNSLSFNAQPRPGSSFMVFDPTTCPSPSWEGAVENQNLRGLPSPDLLIVTHPLFLPAANRLADFRRQNDQLTVAVATTQQIYNEFSGGKQDLVAIRDFARYLYKKGDLKYLLLFGGASADYKDRLPNNTNFVPVYQSRESMHPIFSFSSDDFFGFLDDHEGEWQECSTCNDHSLELGIGRITAFTAQQAEGFVDKLIHYSAHPNALGKWRNRMVMVADDGDFNTHQSQAEQLAVQVEQLDGLFNVERLFIDAFPQESSGDAKRSPVVKEKINQAIGRGALFLNYSGHGSERQWASEQILDIPQIQGWNNVNRLPVLITATCEFGRYDDPSIFSGASQALLNPSGGAIALLTTTRPVFASTNFLLNSAFYQAALPAQNSPQRLGDIFRITKNNAIRGVNNRNFALLGDPSMRLAYPREHVEITQLNGKPVSQTDTLKALQPVLVEGIITNGQGLPNEQFNGVVDIEVYDKMAERRTLGSEGPNSRMSFQSLDHPVFRGQATVTAGKFSFRFVMPKDISYQIGAGRMSFYATPQEGITDAAGYFNGFLVGGSEFMAEPDVTPPLLEAYLDKPSFQPGDRVSTQPLLFLQLEDASGINITGFGPGHEISAMLHETTTEDPARQIGTWNLNDFFQSALDDFTQGSLQFRLPELSAGKYQLTLEAWDVFNNAARKQLNFEIGDGQEVAFADLTCFPNPMQEATTFRFVHDHPGKNVVASIQIFTPEGKLVRRLSENFQNSASEISIHWDRYDQQQGRVGNGLYFYRAILQISNQTEHFSKAGKLVLVD